MRVSLTPQLADRQLIAAMDARDTMSHDSDGRLCSAGGRIRPRLRRAFPPAVRLLPRSRASPLGFTRAGIMSYSPARG